MNTLNILQPRLRLQRPTPNAYPLAISTNQPYGSPSLSPQSPGLVKRPPRKHVLISTKMTASLSPPRVLLLAVHFATKSDVQNLTALVAHHPNVLRPELILRVLLTCLPETLRSSEYVGLIERIESGDLYSEPDLSVQFDSSSVRDITDAEAAKKTRRLRLLPLAWDHAAKDVLTDPVSLFLVHRARRVDQEAGLLTQLPDLVVPFLQHAPCIRTWMISALLPLLRRNYEYYPNEPITQTLESFERLDSRTAVALLLSQTGAREGDLQHVGRDLRGLIGPWMYNNTRWHGSIEGQSSAEDSRLGHVSCPAWEHVLEWLITQASVSWKVAVKAFDQWDGPNDADLGDYGSGWLDDEAQGLLERRFARAALASAYLIPEASVEALSGVNNIIIKIMSLLDQDPCPTLQVASSLLSPFAELEGENLISARSASLMRNDLLEESNYLTTPNQSSTQLLHVLTLSAFILTKAGAPCSVRRAGELAFLQDEREQKADAIRLIRSLSANGPKNDDRYWIRARNELLWLRDWGAEEAFGSSDIRIHGIFGQLEREFLEVECLKAFLTNTRYSMARSIYEDSPEKPLRENILQDTVIAVAMEAYDNASNLHRGRGGLLKCDDIIHAFPQTFPETHPASKRIEALLRATHALSEYRLVLKKGEPFTPVVLRVRADPVSIVGRVLEQNPKSYTNIQDLLDIGSNMVDAGLLDSDKPGQSNITLASSSDHHMATRRRITAMCVDAALTEDDFETAYSYIVNRVASDADSRSTDEYSWKAALQAGKYRRTGRTMKPTHIGTASGNLDIRHLEQRIECLSTAVRIAPPATLQEILNVFRKCEEELNATIKAEEAQESAWDDRGDLQTMPGAFSSTVPAGVVRSATRSSRRVEEAPMSLFDLSRASMARAQHNFSALSSLQRSGQTRASDGEGGFDEVLGQPRVRKRDQLREAAVGTLASGVGWLIGAQPVERGQERE
ncbi:putative secretory pathway protein Sec39 [Rosellinia necatrix]|uniref:Putative secretory pathway protein Sec39 n=1 Tax=Rosellinia necatrix TaxID=77044 RepID=A0A1W2TQS1_ROSNE|nr:putative secretory pathway protein Sec39 [Rosellinia necatrix]